ncbi:hypothetical protein HDU86_006348 [Geranomyces michiganensis]|nr:hypothetical protein HDU86_006348 [Geranomyces michiganensis]
MTTVSTTATDPAQSMSSSSSSTAGITRVLTKLAKSVDDGNYYEAHQMYHSVSRRYLRTDPTAACELLHQGALNMLRHDQIGSAADLAQRLLDVYESVPIRISDDNNRGAAARTRVLNIFHAFPLKTEQCDNFVRAAIKWSARGGNGASPLGDPHMHHAIGSRYYAEMQYFDAETHFIYGTLDSARAWARMALEWSTQGYFPDPGYFVARGVLAYLALRKIGSAAVMFETFVQRIDKAANSSSDGSLAAGGGAQEAGTAAVVERWAGLKGAALPFASADGSESFPLAMYASSLLNFCQFLILCVQRDAATQFSALRARYRDVLAFDGYLVELVDKIAEAFFDLGPKKPVNPLEAMMKSLFAGPSLSAPSSSSRKAVEPAPMVDMD